MPSLRHLAVASSLSEGPIGAHKSKSEQPEATAITSREHPQQSIPVLKPKTGLWMCAPDQLSGHPRNKFNATLPYHNPFGVDALYV